MPSRFAFNIDLTSSVNAPLLLQLVLINLHQAFPYMDDKNMYKILKFWGGGGFVCSFQLRAFSHSYNCQMTRIHMFQVLGVDCNFR